MKFLMMIAVFFTMNMAHAKVSSELSYTRYKNQYHGGLGYVQGGFGLAFDYENRYNNTYGLGAMVRLFPKKSDDTLPRNGLTFIGGFIRPHFHKQEWDLNFTMGAGFSQISSGASGGGNKTVISTAIGYGLYRQINANVAVGVESLSLHGWLQNDFPGNYSSEMLIKVRYGHK